MINQIKNILAKHGIKASNELLKELTEQIEQATKELNEKYRRLTENSPEITYINNLNKGALYWSSKIKDILGFDPKNIVEDTNVWTKSLHPEDIPKINKVLENIRVGKTYEIEYRIYDANKNLHWFYDRIFNVYKKDGDLILEGIITDITNKKIIESELKENEEKFRAITNSAQDAIILIDNKGDVVFWNKAATKILQYDKKEILGKNFHSIVVPSKYIDVHKKNFKTFNKTGKGNAINQIIELSAIRKDGKEIPVELSLSSLKLRDKWHAVGMLRDITERKKSEQALNESEIKYNSLFSSMSEGVVLHEVVYDKNKIAYDYKIIEANKAFEDHTGIQMKKLTNSLASEFYQISPAPYLDIYTRVAETGTATNFETYFSPLKKYFNISVFSPKKGWFATVFADITERKNAEEQLKKQNTLLNDLNATKDKFFSIIAHDLRGPMNNLVGFSDLLERNYQSYDNEKLSHIINLMSTSAKQTYSLLENLLIWARSQRNKLTYNPQIFICKELISEVLQEMEHLALAKGIRFETNKENKGHPVYVDKDMFKTVYRNLISNAIKYTKEGGTITFGCGKITDKFIEFFVKDNGVGIPKDTIEKLFKLDENITTEGTNKEHGTGLGLILCKDFIDKHGGEIWVESEVNIGSTFWFTFPVPEQN